MIHFDSKSHAVTVDKGTWEVFPKERSTEMLREIVRVLRPSGLYFTLTAVPPTTALAYFLDSHVGWKLEKVIEVPKQQIGSNAHANLPWVISWISSLVWLLLGLLFPSADSATDSFYLYVCRNEQRKADWQLTFWMFMC